FQGGKQDDPEAAGHPRFAARMEELPDIDNSRTTFINDGTVIDVSSRDGAGGSAIIWSDEQTTFLGNIEARGATIGGAVEISSAEDLRRADLMNVRVGAGGQLLLDPKNIVIGDSTLAMSWIYDSLLGADADSEEFGSGISINLNGGKIAVGDAWYDNGAGAVFLYSYENEDFGGAVLEARIGRTFVGAKDIM